MPKRIQRRRVKGWRMPEGTVSVSRPGRWGNRFKVGTWFKKITPDWKISSYGNSRYFGDTRVDNLEQSLELFEEYATARVRWDKEWLEPLRGKHLACWCKTSEKCHGDVLIRLANA